MFESLKQQPPDKILELTKMFREDSRGDKVDLGVGVYKNSSGLTPVMAAVKLAEKRLWESEDTKTYTSLAGERAFLDAIAKLALGDSVEAGQIAAAHTPGGTGAVHKGLEIVKMASPDATVWISDPTWPNHTTILKHLSMKAEVYRYFDEESRSVDFEGMLKDLGKARPGDVVLLHGCCHNPTGANLAPGEWETLTAEILSRNLVPMVDLAYQGFGDGLDQDAEGLRGMAKAVPEMMIASSCSKNFGIYRERAGAALLISKDPAQTSLNQDTLAYLNRQNYSFPPHHGAKLVTMVLEDDELAASWREELEMIRLSMLGNRQKLAAELQRLSNSDRFGFLERHRGMFSRLGAKPEQVVEMRERHGIFMTGDSRINIAGLHDGNIERVAKAIIEAGV